MDIKYTEVHIITAHPIDYYSIDMIAQLYCKCFKFH